MRILLQTNELLNKKNINAILFILLGIMVIGSFSNLHYLSVSDSHFKIPIFDLYFEALLTLALGLLFIKNTKNNLLKPGFLLYFILLKIMMGIRIFPLSILKAFISGAILNQPRLFNFSIVNYIEDYFYMKELLGSAPVHFLGNFLLFVPLGFLLVFEISKSIKDSLMIGFIIIFGFEFSQLLSTIGAIGSTNIEFRTFDLVDIITNYIGFCLSYIFIYSMWRLTKHVGNY